MKLAFEIFRSKYFLQPAMSAERKFADLYFKYGPGFDWHGSDFYRLRTGRLTWQDPGVACLPETIEKIPPYWVMPWAAKERPHVGWCERLRRSMGFRQLAGRFFRLCDNIGREGFKNEDSPIKGYLLRAPEGEERFIYIDGNRRLGILASLLERDDTFELKEIHVEVKGVFERDKLFSYPEIIDNMSIYGFTRSEVTAWFEHAMHC